MRWHCFFQERLGGKPFVDKIVKKTDGWYLLDQFKVTNFNFQKSLDIVQTQFMTDAIFKLQIAYVRVGQNKRKKMLKVS